MRHWSSARGFIDFFMRKSRVFVFLDFDGTLSPIVAHPQSAKLAKGAREVLRKLSSIPGIRLAIVSGRGLKDLRARVGLRGVACAANHGLEWEGWGLRGSVAGLSTFKRKARSFNGILERKLRDYPGLYPENKGSSLSIHYRRLKAGLSDSARRFVLREARAHFGAVAFLFRPGKKVWEIRPRSGWDKGRRVLWALKKERFRKDHDAVFYLGDDKTDEDAFRALGSRGISIKISGTLREKTAAAYGLRTPREVVTFLNRLLEVRRKNTENISCSRS